ncbi:hypothetical protein QR685DRAFT_496734 [Neurospora intermedia]|uniref:Uncharacterized protein n=1 Tax=Neurospora intermedia TaxID=5142 RepID=A0ABR3DCA1_NEUIN
MSSRSWMTHRWRMSRFSSLHPPQQAKDLFNYQRRHVNKPTISINALAKTNDTISTRKKSGHQIPESYPSPSLVQANPARYRRAMSYSPTAHHTTFLSKQQHLLYCRLASRGISCPTVRGRRGGTQSPGTSVHTVRPYLGTECVVRFPGVERSPDTDTCRIKPRS